MIGILRTTVLVGAALLAATPSFAQWSVFDHKSLATTPTLEQDKVLYELQQKCSADATNFLNRLKTEDVPGGPVKPAPSALLDLESQSHYSARFKKCFLWVRDTVTAKGGKEQEDFSVWHVNNGRKIAGLWLYYVLIPELRWCWALKPAYINDFDFSESGKNTTDSCGTAPGQPVVRDASLRQWNALIKPYMQDSD